MTKLRLLLQAAAIAAFAAFTVGWCTACGGVDYDALEEAHEKDIQRINNRCARERMDESKTPISDGVLSKAALDELCAGPEAEAKATGARILAEYKAGKLSDEEFTAQIDALQEPYVAACTKNTLDVWWARMDQLHLKSKADPEEVSLWMRANPIGRQTLDERLREIEREFARSHNTHLTKFCRRLKKQANERYEGQVEEADAQEDARRASAMRAVGAGLQAAGKSLQGGVHCTSFQVGGMTQTDCR
jgi:hypothetical protein